MNTANKYCNHRYNRKTACYYILNMLLSILFYFWGAKPNQDTVTTWLCNLNLQFEQTFLNQLEFRRNCKTNGREPAWEFLKWNTVVTFTSLLVNAWYLTLHVPVSIYWTCHEHLIYLQMYWSCFELQGSVQFIFGCNSKTVEMKLILPLWHGANPLFCVSALSSLRKWPRGLTDTFVLLSL